MPRPSRPKMRVTLNAHVCNERGASWNETMFWVVDGHDDLWPPLHGAAWPGMRKALEYLVERAGEKNAPIPLAPRPIYSLTAQVSYAQRRGPFIESRTLTWPVKSSKTLAHLFRLP